MLYIELTKHNDYACIDGTKEIENMEVLKDDGFNRVNTISYDSENMWVKSIHREDTEGSTSSRVAIGFELSAQLILELELFVKVLKADLYEILKDEEEKAND